jgi:hypothetical protein
VTEDLAIDRRQLVRVPPGPGRETAGKNVPLLDDRTETITVSRHDIDRGCGTAMFLDEARVFIAQLNVLVSPCLIGSLVFLILGFKHVELRLQEVEVLVFYRESVPEFFALANQLLPIFAHFEVRDLPLQPTDFSLTPVKITRMFEAGRSD